MRRVLSESDKRRLELCAMCKNKHGHVVIDSHFCGFNRDGSWVLDVDYKIYKVPPDSLDGCKYRLEHLVLWDENNA